MTKHFFFYRLVDPLSGMHSAEFYNLMAKYKFTIAIENSLCEDYITEKLWRTLHLGSVPIVLGSSKIRVRIKQHKATDAFDEILKDIITSLMLKYCVACKIDLSQ